MVSTHRSCRKSCPASPPGEGLTAGKSQTRGRGTTAVHQEEGWTSTLGDYVWAEVGKEFPGMRQNEREITFIRMGSHCHGPAQWRTNVETGVLVHWSGIWGSMVICLV